MIMRILLLASAAAAFIAPPPSDTTISYRPTVSRRSASFSLDQG
ncbi:MAG TPA: hypothetical protein VGN73_08870 [Gemmatimonadaceae bacterium]|nr:hypothetical protein [Gemmatimonadaceae bacterium]